MRITTRTDSGRAAIEAVGAECLIGTPDRLASLRGALEGVTVACWLLGSPVGGPAQARALHGSRVESFLSQAIDTTMRGFVYEAAGVKVEPQIRAEGERIVRTIAQRNAIPVRILRGDIEDGELWQAEAWEAIDSLLGGRAGA